MMYDVCHVHAAKVERVRLRMRADVQIAWHLLHKHKAFYAAARSTHLNRLFGSFGIRHGERFDSATRGHRRNEPLGELHDCLHRAVAHVGLVVVVAPVVQHVHPAAEHADGREALDVVASAQQALHGAVHLREFDATVLWGELAQHHLRGRVPHRSEPPAPRAPRRVEVHQKGGIFFDRFGEGRRVQHVGRFDIRGRSVVRLSVLDVVDQLFVLRLGNVAHDFPHNPTLRIERVLAYRFGEVDAMVSHGVAHIH
mmetsp:Transcript_39356/g.66089  ORF Transcript_39356/g.66089 Transcript_39356/m.66089 type:complete len:254 (-) Transcript_39356:583-1344(-)